ncbi:glucose PTS transporter subunit IIA [Celerinatantimonas sp. YJH-8]|uniref:glucose PTS transporter subunit IIA n=1 Tax=Celerinatantimonas sp. YJH-8 TaxID=3228714 RepID=UPI0038C19AA6
MAKIRDYSKLAQDILQEVGGEANLVSINRCATRLRLELKTCPDTAVERIKKLPGVITVILAGGQFQVVIGTHVGDVYEAISGLVNVSLMASANVAKKGILDSLIAAMAGIFAPVIYILAAAGILQGILILSKLAFPEFIHTGAFNVLNFISWTPFSFLPVFIGITAAKHFKCNPFISVFCCCALINPEWAKMAAEIAQGQSITFAGLPLSKVVYTSSVLPPIFLVWGLSWVERWVERILPDVVKALFTPLICVAIMVPLTLVVIGPVTTEIATWIAQGYNWLYALFPPLAAAVIGGVWQIIVIFGVHWGITPVVFANFQVYGHDSFQAFQTVAVIGQMAAAFACGFRSRNKLFKTTCFSAGLTGVFGITEPAIYGVTLRLKKPFVCGCIGGAVGAVVVSLFGSYYYVYAGLPSILTTVNAISAENPSSFIGEIAGSIVAIVVTIILVYWVGFDDPQPEEDSVESAATPESQGSHATAVLTLVSPVNGSLMALDQVHDEMFSQKMLGDGVAFTPNDGVVKSPCDAVVSSVIDSQHAVGLTSDNGAELLIHVGLDTVNLKGQYFNTVVHEGDRVKTGDPLIYFEKDKIQQSGYDLTTPFLVVNSDEFTLNPMTDAQNITLGQPVLQLSH